MDHHRIPASSLVLGALTALALAGTTADAGDLDDGARMVAAASRCADFGPGFIDLGTGRCARAGGHVRVEMGVRRAAGNGWTGPTATASATLRSEGPEFMPGVGASRQLRVRSGLQTSSPY